MLMQRPLGQTPGKTSHSFTSREQQARRSESSQGAGSLGAQDTTWFLGRWERQCQPPGLGDCAEDPGTKEGDLQ